MPSASSFAKLNLTLRLTGRTPDGYHLLQSLVAFAEIGDTLHAAPADTLRLDVTGPFAAQLADEGDNLVLRAARMLQKAASVTQGAHLVLEKHLPVASGMGGGSGDAAAAMRLLCRMWGVDVPDGQLASLAALLGADVPVCLHSRACWMEGRGERFRPLPTLPPLWAVLVNSCEPLLTGKVFGLFHGEFCAEQPMPEWFADTQALLDYISGEGNDLLAPALMAMPSIQIRLDALESVPQVKLARLSGSGATCFGLCMSEEEANAAAVALKERLPNDWIMAARLR